MDLVSSSTQNRTELQEELLLLQGYESTAGRELTPMEKYRVKAIDPK